MGFIKDFAGINSRKLGFKKDLARIKFCGLQKISRELNFTVTSRKMFQRPYCDGLSENDTIATQTNNN